MIRQKLAILTVLLLGVAGFTGCSASAEVTGAVFCDPSFKTGVNPSVPMYAEPDATSAVVERIQPGTVVKVYDYRNHSWYQKDFVRVKTENKEGFVNPRCMVVGQDPADSVYVQGYKKDYEYFYDPNDKGHYKAGYMYPNLKDLSNDKIPFEKIAGEYAEK